MKRCQSTCPDHGHYCDAADELPHAIHSVSEFCLAVWDDDGNVAHSQRDERREEAATIVQGAANIVHAIAKEET